MPDWHACPDQKGHAVVAGPLARPADELARDAGAFERPARAYRPPHPPVVGASREIGARLPQAFWRASTIGLTRCGPGRISGSASAPKRRATAAPSLPIGGLYRRCTVTRVALPPGTRWKFTEPALTTSDPSSDRHAMSLLATSL